MVVEDIDRIGDGVCNGGIYNSERCNYDGDVCSVCNRVVDNFRRIGDGVCDGGKYNSATFSNGRGDCDEKINQTIEDGQCDKFIVEIKECNFDGGDCVAYLEILEYYGKFENGEFDGQNYNSAICNYDDDDFEKFYKYAMFLDYYRIKIIGEGVYDLSIAYCNECNLDGGDYNDCNDLVIKFERVGDGICDGGSYDSEECKYDGGDCSMCNRIVDDFQKIGDVVCIDGDYTSKVYDLDGGDYNDCKDLVEDF